MAHRFLNNCFSKDGHRPGSLVPGVRSVASQLPAGTTPQPATRGKSVILMGG
ncbi:hypothetical protein HL657_10575 [Methanoculleus sp. YWC-01]|uniref:Uncharacterized protein n=1 Tax=Methanoculleus nereidis TaxID=2735141 RepID=A0ABU3Z4X3_9EURY|nr:hypothetical protein [Methanoculleus sp. YWC-01]MCK9299300.1 hypothetical protein [Methanoculleus sp.]MDV4343604.1 hypothetical protein [Methanoculleus sp. YWC-01]